MIASLIGQKIQPFIDELVDYLAAAQQLEVIVESEIHEETGLEDHREIVVGAGKTITIRINGGAKGERVVTCNRF